MRDEWQPIETAPKDETKILGYSESEGYAVWWWSKLVIETKDRGSWCNISEEYYAMAEPTHWMPLPKPPIGYPCITRDEERPLK